MSDGKHGMSGNGRRVNSDDKWKNGDECGKNDDECGRVGRAAMEADELVFVSSQVHRSFK